MFLKCIVNSVRKCKVIETVLVRKQPLIPFFRISKIEGVKKIIQAENKQPIKEISHQNIYALYDIWEQLQSWQEVLPVLENFFDDKNRPINKQQIARKYYACSQIFMLFYQDFSQTIQKMEKQLLELRSKKKV